MTASKPVDMIAKELQDWFPEAQISDQPVEKEGYLTLPLASQQWILLEEAGLSEREKQLVALLTQQDQARSLNPWFPVSIAPHQTNARLLGV